MEFTAKRKRQKVKARVTGFAVAQEKGSSKQHEVRFVIKKNTFQRIRRKPSNTNTTTDLRNENSMGNGSNVDEL